MSAAPMFNAWAYFQRERHERGLPRISHWYLHPKDSWNLEEELYTNISLIGVAIRGRPGTTMLYDVEVSVQQGVAEGWWLTESTPGRPGLIYTMHQFRCLVHEDCAKNYGLGIACLASLNEGGGT
jgi:hypothetical protein